MYIISQRHQIRSFMTAVFFSLKRAVIQIASGNIHQPLSATDYDRSGDKFSAFSDHFFSLFFLISPLKSGVLYK